MAKIKYGLIIFLILFLTIAWIGVIPVQAHAVLMRSIPDANASLVSAPPQIELFFSESIAANLSKIKVMDSTGKQLNSAAVSLDPADSTHLIAPLPALADGVYTVAWSVISATDGHETTGAFPFLVGQAASGAALTNSVTPTTTSTTPIGEMVTKGLLYLASAVLLGSIMFTFLGWKTSLEQTHITEEGLGAFARLMHGLWIAAIIILITSAILRIMFEAGTASGTLIGWPWQPAFVLILTGTRVGILSIAQVVLAGILAALLLPRKGRLNRWSVLGANLLLLATFCLQCHAASVPKPLLPILADYIHLLGMSTWVGGLFAFLAGMRTIRVLEPETRTRLTSILIPHFTTLAMASVFVLVLTGIYASILHVGSLNELVGTQYGKALLIKLAIAAPMLGLGGFHFMFTTRLMRKAALQPGGSPKLVNFFHVLLSGEATLGIAILLWVGVFTTLPPARVISPPPAYHQVTQADDLTVSLSIDPLRAGTNNFTVVITSGGKPVTNATNVSLEFTDLSGMVPDAKAAMNDQGGGEYTLQGGYLGMAGPWDIKVVVLRTGKFDAYADFKAQVKK